MIEQITTQFSPAEMDYIRQLVETGAYGNSVSEVVHTLVMERIREECRRSGIMAITSGGSEGL